MDESPGIPAGGEPLAPAPPAPAPWAPSGPARPRFARVGVVGLGYVGLPLASAYLRGGLEVLGFDADAGRRSLLRAGRSPLPHLDPADWRPSSDRALEVVDDLARVGECDALSLCLPTPLGPDGDPDLEPLRAAARALAPHLRPGQVVVLHSTTWPGTTRRVLAPLLSTGGLTVGRDLWLAHSPEREDPGRGLPTHVVPRLVGGLCPRSTRLAVELLARAVERVHPVESAEVAEAAKLHENVYRAVNIALVTELERVYRGLGLDPHAVVDAAATKPFGFEAFRPGPGPGGHCIPVDPRYLSWSAERAGVPSPMLELTLAINAEAPRRLLAEALAILGREGRPPAATRALVLGLAYKPEVGDLRESPALGIVRGLLEAGVEVRWSDPWVDPGEEPLRALAGGVATPDGVPAPRFHGPVPCSEAELAAADLVLLLTDHRAFDLDAVAVSGRPTLDPRGALRGRRSR